MALTFAAQISQEICPFLSALALPGREPLSLQGWGCGSCRMTSTIPSDATDTFSAPPIRAQNFYSLAAAAVAEHQSTRRVIYGLWQTKWRRLRVCLSRAASNYGSTISGPAPPGRWLWLPLVPSPDQEWCGLTAAGQARLDKTPNSGRWCAATSLVSNQARQSERGCRHPLD